MAFKINTAIGDADYGINMGKEFKILNQIIAN